MRWAALCLTACISSAEAPPPDPATHAASSPVAAPEAPAWTKVPPTETAGTWNGCVVSAAGSIVTLSVDGDLKGMFAVDVRPASGQFSIDPTGPSAARIVAGVAEFDTRMMTDSARLPSPVRPAEPIGGILHLARDAQVRIVGGNKDLLKLAIVDRDGELSWVEEPSIEIACGDWGKARRGDELPRPGGEGKRTVAPRMMMASKIRATESGPVVARLKVTEATVLGERQDMLFIRAPTSMGWVVGYVESKDWEAPSPPRAPERGGTGRGSGNLRSRRFITCDVGAPLYTLRDDRLFRVGTLRDAKESSNWRIAERRFVLSKTFTSATGGYGVLGDDLDFQKRVADSFVVPLASCRE